MLGTMRDITQRLQAQELIRASLHEKEVLLREIHHRVKNNLQVISSLLSLQSRYVDDQRVVEMFRESQDRVRAMALVHEKLYDSPDLARVDLAKYVHDLANHVFRVYHTRVRGVSLKIESGDVFLDIDAAVSCGLIVNELLSNALKYAFVSPFPPSGGPEIRIGFVLNKDNVTRAKSIQMTVRDNGVGFPPDVDFRDTKTLGLRLVVMLVRQLQGSIELERAESPATRGHSGTIFTIEFDAQVSKGLVK